MKSESVTIILEVKKSEVQVGTDVPMKSQSMHKIDGIKQGEW